MLTTDASVVINDDTKQPTVVWLALIVVTNKTDYFGSVANNSDTYLFDFYKLVILDWVQLILTKVNSMPMIMSSSLINI